MNVEALLCVRCGGPLTRPADLPALVDCVFCGTVMSVSRDRAELSQQATPADLQRDRRQRFHDALVAALQSGASPQAAVRDAARTHLELGAQADPAARIAITLVREFERDSGLDCAKEPLVLARIVQAYLLALDDLRTAATAEINLPFLWASASGPRHLQRKVTAQLFAQMAAHDPDATPPPPATPPAAPAVDAPPTAPPAKKRWWWPFGS
jgi:hypothetical protein